MIVRLARLTQNDPSMSFWIQVVKLYRRIWSLKGLCSLKKKCCTFFELIKGSLKRNSKKMRVVKKCDKNRRNFSSAIGKFSKSCEKLTLGRNLSYGKKKGGILVQSLFLSSKSRTIPSTFQLKWLRFARNKDYLDSLSIQRSLKNIACSKSCDFDSELQYLNFINFRAFNDHTQLLNNSILCNF